MFTIKRPEKPKKPDKATWKLCSKERPPWETAVMFNVLEASEDDEDLPTEMFIGVLTMAISTKEGTKFRVKTIAGEITITAECTEWMENPKPSNRKPGGTA